jgi:serine protease Do
MAFKVDRLRIHSLIACLCIVLLAACAVFSIAAQQISRVYPLPVSELAGVVSDWLAGAGYRVERVERYPVQVELNALKNGEHWKLAFSSHSVLASELVIENHGVSRNGDLLPRLLDDYINAYAGRDNGAEQNNGRDIPQAVLSHIRSVVCIQADLKGKSAQQSGFLIADRGLVLSTVHDLENTRQVTVITLSGQRHRGEVVSYDAHNDLALIQTEVVQDRYVRVRDGRNRLRMGEPIFSVGCPRNLIGTVYAGSVNGLPRRVDDRAYWQVNMEIHPGSSGSPVFDPQGRLVGMVKGRYRGTDTIGFIIPYETILSFLKNQ